MNSKILFHRHNRIAFNTKPFEQIEFWNAIMILSLVSNILFQKYEITIKIDIHSQILYSNNINYDLIIAFKNSQFEL